ncbi:HAD-IA family hydrolase [Pseudobacter ginsenosidimutans]|jgi:sugar-phosphatase|uniref:Sugar-phosphatase n=1 Tax=Pseudobacter ginsenosidimutans TaxID=661488 RepID=A0A4Q7N119_9BACT|nr:HAD-IA family hydrolase [Pseudobacter ginsenosidimutans]QEC43874.1 HAD-IA family hydrolase [Pseudobacter ginsenosidimutans]RZS75300.1 sugar-phosphatase [Pseudobacter ginsenosidimutans]
MQQQIDAVLLDMDGTILNSIKSAERVWTTWALRNGIDVESFLPTIHGIQAVETIRRLALPGMDPVAEAAALTLAEIDDVAGIEPIAGAANFLAALSPYRWAVVTSAPRELATRRIQAAGLPLPPLMITAEDVPNSKPAPDGFQLAAEKLGTTAGKCLVLEDSPAGILAGERAGSQVLVITATHHKKMENNYPAITDYNDLNFATDANGALEIRGVGNDSHIHFVLK